MFEEITRPLMNEKGRELLAKSFSNFWYCDTETFGNVHFALFKNLDLTEERLYVIGMGRNDSEAYRQFLLQPDLTLSAHNIMEYDSFLFNAVLQHPDITAEMLFNLNNLYFDSNRNRKLKWSDQYKRYSEYERPYTVVCTLQLTKKGFSAVGLKAAGIHGKYPFLRELPHAPGSVLTEDMLTEGLEYIHHDVNIQAIITTKLADTIDVRLYMNNLYDLDLLSASDSDVKNQVIQSRLNVQLSNKDGTYRETLALTDCILPMIKFDTPEFQRALAYYKTAVVAPNDDYRVVSDMFGTYTGKEAPVRKVKIDFKALGKRWIIGRGGVHTEDESQVLYGAGHPDDVDDPEAEIVADFDIESQHPGAAIEWGFFPEHLEDTNLRPVFTGLRDERTNAKGNRYNEDKAIAEKSSKLSDGLKIPINSFAGGMNYEGSPYYDPKPYHQITLTSQFSIMRLAELMHAMGAEIKSANTDGLTVVYKRKDHDNIMAVCKIFEAEYRFKLEDVYYKQMHQIKGNIYICETSKGKVKRKGKYFNLPWEYPPGNQFGLGWEAPIVAQVAGRHLLYDVDIHDEIKACKDIHLFAYTQKAGKDNDGNQYHYYMFEGDTPPTKLKQLRNRWLVTESGGTLKKIADNTGRTQTVNKDRLVTIANNIGSIDDYKLDYNHYIMEVNNIVAKLDKPQAEQLGFFGMMEDIGAVRDKGKSNNEETYLYVQFDEGDVPENSAVESSNGGGEYPNTTAPQQIQPVPKNEPIQAVLFGDHKIEMAYNNTHIDKHPADMDPEASNRWFQRYNQSFANRHMTVDQLMHKVIQAGYGITSPHGAGNRHSRNWQSSWHLGLDFDGGATIKQVLNDPFVVNYAAFAYTTPSHTDEEHRLRVIFISKTAVTDKQRYSDMAVGLTVKYDGKADASAKDVARLFYGSKDCQMWEFGNLFDQDEMYHHLKPFADRVNKAKTYSGQFIPPSAMTADKINWHIENQLRKLRSIPDSGAHKSVGKRDALRDVAYTFGGWAAFNYIGLPSVRSALYDWVESRNDLKDPRVAYSTIEESLRRGLENPIGISLAQTDEVQPISQQRTAEEWQKITHESSVVLKRLIEDGILKPDDVLSVDDVIRLGIGYQTIIDKDTGEVIGDFRRTPLGHHDFPSNVEFAYNDGRLAYDKIQPSPFYFPERTNSDLLILLPTTADSMRIWVKTGSSDTFQLGGAAEVPLNAEWLDPYKEIYILLKRGQRMGKRFPIEMVNKVKVGHYNEHMLGVNGALELMAENCRPIHA